LRGQHGFQLVTEGAHVTTVGRSRTRGGRYNPPESPCMRHVFDRLDSVERHRLAHINRDLHARCLEYSEFLESYLDGHRQLPDFFLIDLRCGVKDHEESKEQRDEISVGDQPALMISMFGMSLFPAHECAAASAFLSFVSFASLRKPNSFVSSMRGFMPSRMEITPSRVISRITWSSRMRIFSLPAAGRKNRLAAPTP